MLLTFQIAVRKTALWDYLGDFKVIHNNHMECMNVLFNPIRRRFIQLRIQKI